MEFSYTRPRGQQGGEASSHQAGNILNANLGAADAKNDRLQKAIARNRAKQAKRGATTNSPPPPPEELTATRRTVGTANSVEFTGELTKPATKRPSATVGYSTAKRKVRTRSKNKKDNVYLPYLIKASWCFCIFLLFRLVFSDGGVVDYYSSLDILEGKQQEYKWILNENEELLATIKKIRTNPRHQRKLVRDNLGFIASNEYLILFPKERDVSSN